MCRLLNESVKISVACSQNRRFTRSSNTRASFSLALFKHFFHSDPQKSIDGGGFGLTERPNGWLTAAKRQCIADFSTKRQRLPVPRSTAFARDSPLHSQVVAGPCQIDKTKLVRQAIQNLKDGPLGNYHGRSARADGEGSKSGYC